MKSMRELGWIPEEDVPKLGRALDVVAERPLQVCDGCLRSEIDDLLESKPDLIPMRRAPDGHLWCPQCDNGDGA